MLTSVIQLYLKIWESHICSLITKAALKEKKKAFTGPPATAGHHPAANSRLWPRRLTGGGGISSFSSCEHQAALWLIKCHVIAPYNYDFLCLGDRRDGFSQDDYWCCRQWFHASVKSKQRKLVCKYWHPCSKCLLFRGFFDSQEEILLSTDGYVKNWQALSVQVRLKCT